MWKNFIRVTIRSISKNKAFNAINIAGLAIGLASAIFIILYINSETSYDRFNERSADIYRLYLEGKMAGEEFTGAWVSPIVAPAFHEEIPEVENFCRIDWANNRLMWADPDNKYLENQLLYADSTFFDIFSFKVLLGAKNQLLTSPNSVVLTESTCQKLFPNENPIGRILNSGLVVTGVVEDIPGNSSIEFNYLSLLIFHPNIYRYSD